MTEKRNPIKIELTGKDEYKLTLKLDHWELSKIVSEAALTELQNEINNATGLTRISETFNCNGNDARKIKDFWDDKLNWKRCKECNFKWKECFDCVVKCDSPLERSLLLVLRKNDIDTVMQRRINKDGSFYDFPQSIDFDTILTIPDFYIEKGDIKLCVYADGHTYHERTEKQALRDRNIDRELGFITPDNGGTDVFVHVSAVLSGGPLRDATKVSYDIGQDRKTGKSKAENVRAV